MAKASTPMSRLPYFVALLLSVSLCDASAVITISGKDQFAAAVKANAFIAVEFYSPGCGYCKQLEPHWEKAATQLKAKNIALAKVDATTSANAPLSAQYEIRGYPTIKIFRNGDFSSPIEYKGPRDTEGIVSYLLKQSQATLTMLESKEQVEKLQKESEVGIIAFIPDAAKKGDSAAFKAYEEMASKFVGEATCSYVTKRDFLEECSSGVDCDSPFAILTKNQQKPVKAVKYEGKFSTELLTQWADSHAAPLIATFNMNDQTDMKNFQKAVRVQLPHFFVFYNKDKEITIEVINAIKAAAESNGDVKFFYAAKSSADRLLGFLGPPQNAKMPMFFINDVTTKKKFYKDGVLLENLPEFLEEFKVGALEPYMRSEDPSKIKNDGPLITVTANSYKELVLDAGKSVFLELYSPQCGHCKKLAKPWENTAKHFANNDQLSIAKMDATMNDVPDSRIDLRGYPTLVWIPKSGGEVTVYSGGREEKDLIAFVNKQLEKEEQKSVDGGEEKKEEEEEESHDEL